MCMPKTPSYSAPAPLAPVVDTTANNTAYTTASSNAAAQAALASGQQSTLLTSPLANINQANTTQKTLLGQ